MKIRNGFVSNSSSSSFVLMASQEAFDKAYCSLHPILKEIIDAFTIKGKVGNVVVKGLSYGVGLNCEGTEYDIEDVVSSYKYNHPDEDYSVFDNPNPEEEYWDDPLGYCSLENFEQEIKKIAKEMGEEILTHTEGRG